MRALLGAAAGPVDFALLGARLDCADLALGGFTPASLAELEALAARSHGSLWQLAAALLDRGASGPTLAAAATLGRAFGLLAARGVVPGIEPAALAARAQALIESSGVALPEACAPALAGLIVARTLARAELEGRRRARPGRFVQPWIAWRAARRARRPPSP